MQLAYTTHIAPLLASAQVGTLVQVDPAAMFLSTLQMVLAPVFLGAILNQSFPKTVKRVSRFTPLMATILCVLIVGSMLANNIAIIKQSGAKLLSAVFTLHATGFGLGYFVSRAMGLQEKVCRTNSIEVGMQNSALAGVLATLHFADPTVAAPCAISACTHATLGSLLAGFWRLSTPEDEAAPGAA